MNTHNTRQFQANEAVRESVPLLVGLMGPSGGGKTFSALRLATGIQRVTGGDIYGVDTEARRMLHYADRFKFKHVPFSAPFGSLDYLDVLRFCVARGARVIIVDSMSHEHEGPGGMIDLHEKELDRLAKDDWDKRERVKMLAWQKPKANRRTLINGLLQLEANFIFCFRAKQTAKPMKIKGKTEVVPLGFMPIAGEEFVFEQTVNCLLLPAANGVPTWKSENMGERQMMKLPSQFKKIFADEQPLSEDIGQQLAQWAKGNVARNGQHDFEDGQGGNEDSATDLVEWDAALTEAASNGVEALKAAWVGIPATVKTMLKASLDRRHKPAAEQADAEKVAAE